MKNLSYLLATAAMIFAGTSIGKAQHYYDALSWPGEGVSEIEVGENVVLQAAHSLEPSFYNGKRNDKTISEKNLFCFEKAESDLSGKSTYYLKQVSTGFYLQGKDWTDGAVKFAKSKFKAQPLWVQKAQEFYYKDPSEGINEWPGDDVDDWTVAAIYDKSHYHQTAPEGAFIISLSDQPKYFLNNYWGSGAAFWQYSDTNTWYISDVEKKIGLDRLETMLADLFPSGEADLYKVGTEAGEVDASAAKVAEDAIKVANDILESENPDIAASEQAADNLHEAYELYVNSVIGVKSGYYLIHDYRCESQNPEWNYVCYGIYDDQPYLGMTAFARVDQVPDLENLSVEDAKYVWRFEEQENGKFKVKNFGSDLYIQAKMKKVHPQNSNAYFLISKDPTEAGEFVIESSPAYKGGFNITVGPNFSGAHGMWNTCRNGVFFGICEWKDYNDQGSTWKFTPVSEERIELLREDVDKNKEIMRLKARNDKMGRLISDAKSAYNSNEKYVFVEGQGNVSEEGIFNFDNLGLCPEKEMLSSNSADETEGKDIGAIIDNDKSTYFHTTWHANQNVKEHHYIQFELTEAVKVAQFQLLKRQGASGELKKVKILGSNDPNAAAEDWTDVGSFAVDYNRDCQVPNSDYPEQMDTLKNNVALIGFEMPEAYKHIRLVCLKNASNSGPHGFQWMHMAEARIFQAKYDAEGSLNFTVDQAVKDALHAAIAKGEEELKDSLSTQASIDLLQKAYDDYNKATPKPYEVINLCKVYQQLCDNAEEGEELGFFEEGAKEAFQVVIDEVKENWKETMSLSEVHSAVKLLNDGYETFNVKLHKPEAGKYYRIVCATDNLDEESNPVFHYGHYLYTNGSGESPVLWGGRTDDGSDEEGLENKICFYWKLIDNGDGTYKLKNAAYGTHMGNSLETSGSRVSMRTQEDSISLSLTSFKPGTFDIELLNKNYLNIDPNTNQRKVTIADKANSNTYLTFQEVDEWDVDEALSRIWAGNNARIKTLPYAINPEGSMGVTLYSVLGVNKPSEESCRIYLEFKEYEDVIPAGTPFIMVAEKVENENGELESLNWVDLQVDGIEEGLDDIKYSQEAGKQEHEGTILQGTFVPTMTEAQSYYINGKGNLVLTYETTKKTGYNSGWFTVLAPTQEQGDFHLLVDPEAWENISDGIGDVQVDVVTDKIFDLQGRQVQKAEKGIYIINGKKVLK